MPLINQSGKEYVTFESIKRRAQVVKATVRYRDVDDLIVKARRAGSATGRDEVHRSQATGSYVVSAFPGPWAQRAKAAGGASFTCAIRSQSRSPSSRGYSCVRRMTVHRSKSLQSNGASDHRALRRQARSPPPGGRVTAVAESPYSRRLWQGRLATGRTAPAGSEPHAERRSS